MQKIKKVTGSQDDDFGGDMESPSVAKAGLLFDLTAGLKAPRLQNEHRT
jgi:hypothetical protein